MLFMVIERFVNADPRPTYRHLRDEGRGVPEGLRYVDSWVEPASAETRANVEPLLSRKRATPHRK